MLHPAIAARIEIRTDDGAPTLVPLLGGEDKLDEMWESAVRHKFATRRPTQTAARSPWGGGATAGAAPAEAEDGDEGLAAVDALLWVAAAAGVAWAAVARPRDYSALSGAILAAAALLQLVLWLLGRT